MMTPALGPSLSKAGSKYLDLMPERTVLRGGGGRPTSVLLFSVIEPVAYARSQLPPKRDSRCSSTGRVARTSWLTACSSASARNESWVVRQLGQCILASSAVDRFGLAGAGCACKSRPAPDRRRADSCNWKQAQVNRYQSASRRQLPHSPPDLLPHAREGSRCS